MQDFIQQNINSQLSFLLYQLEGLNNNFLKKRHFPLKWSIHEHLAHLGCYQEIFLTRLSVILDRDIPNLQRYKADNDSAFYEWCQLSTKEIIRKTIKKRLEINQFLKQLSKKQLKRIGIHPKLGNMSIEDWASFFILHESHHIYAIFGIKQRFRSDDK